MIGGHGSCMNGLRRPASGSEDGVALVVVLWFVAAMSALAVTLSTMGRETAQASRNAVWATDSRVAMTSAVTIAATSLWQGSFPLSGQLSWREEGKSVRVTVTPESSKIDLNAAGDDLIEGLAQVVTGETQSGVALGHAILDWRDADRERRLAGAEAADYARAGLTARPRDGPFHFTAELRSVIGMDRALFARMQQAVTVHSGQPEPQGLGLLPLVAQAVDRAKGLGGRSDAAEMTFDPDVPPLEEATGDASAFISIADPAGLYTLDIEVAHDNGPSFRQQTVIWIDPPLGTARYAVLQNRSALLPQAAASALASGELPWPAQ